MELKCIDLFAGIGAWELASNLVSSISQIKLETIEFIEINPYSQKILQTHFPQIPIHSDIQDYLPVKNKADVYYCSFPCTGTSRAGKKTGLIHVESSLWFQALRCIILGRPSFVLVENLVYNQLGTSILKQIQLHILRFGRFVNEMFPTLTDFN
ncbi:DNA cytosine methyltransferase [Microcoleus sp. K4-B3]|uniref:DNA cytosine methyltransferase n=1 Tax=Microcoleus sp. K4-B3 TaxID=2818791 RepID=UPI0040406E2A